MWRFPSVLTLALFTGQGGDAGATSEALPQTGVLASLPLLRIAIVLAVAGGLALYAARRRRRQSRRI